MITSIIITAAANEPIKDPDIRLQKESNSWQKANQLALVLPLCAKYTMAVAEEAPAVTRVSITFTHKFQALYYKSILDQLSGIGNRQAYWSNLICSMIRGTERISIFTKSKTSNKILLFLAAVLIMWKIDKGTERARYPHTIELAIMKNLYS